MNWINKIDECIEYSPSKSNLNTILVSQDIFINIYKYIDYGYYKGYRVLIEEYYTKDSLVIVNDENWFLNKKINELYKF